MLFENCSNGSERREGNDADRRGQWRQEQHRSSVLFYVDPQDRTIGAVGDRGSSSCLQYAEDCLPLLRTVPFMH